MSIPITGRGAVFAVVGVLLLAAVATAPRSDASTLYACVKKSGAARILTKKPRCKRDETKLSWNTTGPPGQNGAAGKEGAPGKEGKEGGSGGKGLTGSTGPAGEKGATGPEGGSSGGKGATGATGPTGPAGPTGGKGATGPEGGSSGGAGATGATGPTGEKGATGPTGPEGTGGGGSSGTATNFGVYTGAGATGGLASGKQESGLWSATIHTPAGTEQEQTQGVASFPIPLKTKEKVTLNYRNEAEALTATAPCVGSTSEPVINPVGNFCAYRGGKSAGSKETGTGVGNVDKNVTSRPFFEGFAGEKIEETGLAGEGDDGILIVFRTSEFSTGAPVEGILAESNLNAAGSWAVAAK